MFKIINLTKKYKSKEGVVTSALNNINLTFASRGIIFLTGKSGSGKTTLLNLIGGMDKSDSGEIVIHGKSDKNFKASDYDAYRNNYVGFVFQDFCILEDYTVAENIALAFGLQGREATREEVEAILSKVDLNGYYDRRPNELSGGQKQRVAIARALIKNPEIILADEPTGNLDSVTGAEIFELLHKLSEERLVVVVSHDRDAAYKYGDRIITLSDGNIQSDELNSKDISSDAITILDNDIYLPKRKLTTEELIVLNKGIKDGKKLAKRSNVTISEEDVLEDNKAFKAVKNRLPIKTAYKLGVAGMKLRPGRVIGVIILMVMALTLLSTVSVAFFFDQGVSLSYVLDRADVDYAIFRYGAEKEDFINYYYNNNSNMPISSYENIISECEDLYVTPIYDIDTEYLYHDARNYSNQYTDVSGLIVISSDKLTEKLKYGIAYGEYPLAGSGEIAITDYLADLLIDVDLYSSYVDILTKGFDDNKGYIIPISGIINTDYKVKYAGIYDREIADVDYTERTQKFDYEKRSYYTLFYTEDISSAETFLSEKNANYQMIDIIEGYSERTIFIGRESLLEIMMEVEEQILTYIDPLINPSEITLSGNDVIIDKTFYNYLTGSNSITLPLETEFMGATINIVGVLNRDKQGINASMFMFTDDAFLSNFQGDEIELKAVFTSLYDNPMKNAELFNNLLENRILNDTYYSVIINDVNGFIFILRYILLGIGGFFMVYSTIMLFNFISLSVNAKSKDIGILRAIGARSWDTAIIFWIEALIIAIASALFSYLSTLGGIALLNKGFMYISYYDVTPDFNISFFHLDLISMGIIFALSVVIASLGALIPVIRLTHMRPVDAIKKN